MSGSIQSPAAGHRPQDLTRLHVAVLGFGLAGVFGKLVSLGPSAMVAGRAAFAALAIALGFLLAGQGRTLVPGRRADLFPLSLGVLLAVHWWTFFQAVKVATVGVALVSYALAPIFVLALEAGWYRRWPGLRPALASLAALGGVALLAPSLRVADTTVQGMLWGTTSGAAYALLTLANRPLVARASPWRLALWQNAVAALVLAPAALHGGGRPSLRDWGLMALLGTVFTAGTHGLFLRSLRTVPTHLAVLTCTLEPGYGMLAAAVLLGERPSLRTLLGAGVVAASVAHVTLGTRRAMIRTPGDPDHDHRRP